MSSHIKTFFSTVTSNHERHHSTFVAILLKHSELISALISGLLILVVFLSKEHLPTFLFYTLMISAFVVGGYHKAKEGIQETVSDKKLNVELLMIFAAIGACIIGYWLEGAILIFIFSLSGALETYTENKSKKELKSLMNLQPETALLVTQQGTQLVEIAELNVGDHIFVKAGEKVPVDGTIIHGSTAIDESYLTGESIPVTKGKDDTVFASTINLNGSITVVVDKLPTETLFQKIVHLVQEAQQSKSPSQAFIEKFESSYVKIVFLIVGMMMVLPPFLFGWSWQDTFYRAMILLVVASPCALVASVMPATLSAISNSAKNGILAKGGVHLENLASIQAIVFDKTGTLTNGTPIVTNQLFAEHVNKARTIQMVYTMEKHSNHPLAKALITWCEQEYNVDTLPLNNVTHVDGLGVKTMVDGEEWRIGNAVFVGKEKAEDFRQHLQNTAACSHVFVAKDEQIIAMFTLQDTIREDSRNAIHELKALGIEPIMLTGDNENIARAIANQLGIDHYKANCLPTDKVNEINKLKQKYKNIAMTGDGMNDAPALATANVGIAMGTGSEVAIETADVILIKNELSKIIRTIHLSKKMNRIIKQNIIFSIAVILTLILANFVQILDLPLGVIGHEGSTILVILNGLRLLSKAETPV